MEKLPSQWISLNEINTKTQSYLCHQDADHHPQLVQGAEGSTDSSGRDFTHVHGRESCKQAAEHANDEAADDDHLIGPRRRGQSHETSADQSQDVSQQHRLPPGEEKRREKVLSQVSICAWGKEDLTFSLSINLMRNHVNQIAMLQDIISHVTCPQHIRSVPSDLTSRRSRFLWEAAAFQLGDLSSKLLCYLMSFS